MSKPFVGLSQRSSPIRFLGLVLLWCFLALVFLLYTLHNYAMIEQAPTDLNKLYDFKLFYSSVLDFFSGGKLYQPSATLPFERVLYSSSNNSPVGALVFVPLSQLPVTLAGGVWAFFSLLLLLRGIIYIWQVYSVPQQWHWRIALLLLIYVSFPVVDTIQLGSWGMIIAFFDFAVWYYARKGREKRAGILLGLALTIRWQPFVIFLYFISLQRWRIVVYTVASAIVAGILAILVFGVTSYIEFAELVAGFAGGGGTGAYDGTLRTGLSRFLIFLAGSNSAYISVFSVVLTLILLILTLWKCRSLNFDYAYSLCIVCGLLVTPSTWFHYHMALLLPLVVVAQKRWWAAVPTLFLWLSINLITNLDFESNPLLFGTLLTISLLVVYGGLYFGPKEKEVNNLRAKAAGGTPL